MGVPKFNKQRIKSCCKKTKPQTLFEVVVVVVHCHHCPAKILLEQILFVLHPRCSGHGAGACHFFKGILRHRLHRLVKDMVFHTQRLATWSVKHGFVASAKCLQKLAIVWLLH